MWAVLTGQFLLRPPPTKLILAAYVCKYAHLSVHTCICVSRCGHISLVYIVCINLHVYVCACSYIYICGHVHVPLHMHACLSVCSYTHIHMWACACVLPHRQQDKTSLLWMTISTLASTLSLGIIHIFPSLRLLQCFSQALLIPSNTILSRSMLLNMAATQHILYWLFPKIPPGSCRNHRVAPARGCIEESVTSR